MAFSVIPIGALRKRVESLANWLSQFGLRCEVQAHASGHGGDTRMTRPSYVELIYEDEWIDSSGDGQHVWHQLHFLANGYGDLHGSRSEIGGMHGWKPMKARALILIMDDLRRSEWPGLREMEARLS